MLLIKFDDRVNRFKNIIEIGILCPEMTVQKIFIVF